MSIIGFLEHHQFSWVLSAFPNITNSLKYYLFVRAASFLPSTISFPEHHHSPEYYQLSWAPPVLPNNIYLPEQHLFSRVLSTFSSNICSPEYYWLSWAPSVRLGISGSPESYLLSQVLIFGHLICVAYVTIYQNILVPLTYNKEGICQRRQSLYVIVVP